MFRYLPIAEHLHSDDIGDYIAFGISVLNSHHHEVERISDVSLHLKQIATLCEKCNTLALLPTHLRDVVEDFLADL